MAVTVTALALVVGFAGGTGISAPLLHMLLRRARRAETAALTDTLTRLPNRLGFFEATTQLIKERATLSGPVVVGLLDLNGFKRINDEWGHETGDWALMRIARNLRTALGEREIVARLGGDEFAMALVPPPQAGDRSWINDAAEAICSAVADPLILTGYPLPPVTASLGLRLITDPAAHVGRAVHEADIAMYHTKKGKRSGFTIYDPDQMPDPTPAPRIQRPPVRVRECSE